MFLYAGHRRDPEEAETGFKKSDAAEEHPAGETGAPHFAHHLHGSRVDLGDQILVSGRVMGDEPWQVKWTVNGHDIDALDSAERNRYRISSVLDGLQILCIEECGRGDHGEYMCSVSNAKGQASSACFVDVNFVEQPLFVGLYRS